MELGDIVGFVVGVGAFSAVGWAAISDWLARAVGPLSPDAREVRRQHRRAPASWIGELPEHRLGRMAGRVGALDQSLRAPLSGRPCVYYSVVLERRDGRPWQEHGTERAGVPFLIEDKTGCAVVDPADATVLAKFDHHEHTCALGPVSSRQEALLVRQGHDAHRSRRGLFATDSLRFHEAVIAVGDDVTVAGAGTREPDPRALDLDYRAAMPTLLRVKQSPGTPLSIRAARR